MSVMQQATADEVRSSSFFFVIIFRRWIALQEVNPASPVSARPSESESELNTKNDKQMAANKSKASSEMP